MTNNLKLLGFSENEAQVYTALYKLGEGSVGEVSKQSKVNRATVYGVLASLKDKGAVREKIIRSTRYYSPVSIDTLASGVMLQVDDFTKAVESIKSLTKDDVSQPRVEFFEGKDGVATLMDDALNAEGEILGYVNPESILHSTLYYLNRYIYKPARIKKGIAFRALYLRNDASLFAKASSGGANRHIRLLPKDEFSLSFEIRIYNDKIASIYYKESEVYGTLLQDADLAKTEKSKFELLWEYSLKFDQTIPKGFDYKQYERDVIGPVDRQAKLLYQ